MTETMERFADISTDGLYRYGLLRRWSRDEAAFATFVMLNPSTADGTVDDPTIRRCIGFAKSWGMGGMHVMNLYAYRTAKPDFMWLAHQNGLDIVGPDNDRRLVSHLLTHQRTDWPLVAAWGTRARLPRVEAVLGLVPRAPWQCLGYSQGGRSPRHPLYLKSSTQLTSFPPPTA